MGTQYDNVGNAKPGVTILCVLRGLGTVAVGSSHGLQREIPYQRSAGGLWHRSHQPTSKVVLFFFFLVGFFLFCLFLCVVCCVYDVFVCVFFSFSVVVFEALGGRRRRKKVTFENKISGQQ